MTPHEARKFCKEFTPTVGPRAKIWISLNGTLSDKPLGVSIYEYWPDSDHKISFNVDDFEEACALLPTKWAENMEKNDAGKVEKLALEIIRITDNKGRCSDFDLRCLIGFSHDDVERLSLRACEAANRMAGRGPFSIVKTDSNGAPDDEAQS